MKQQEKDDITSIAYVLITANKLKMALDAINEIGIDYFSQNKDLHITLASHCLNYNRHSFLQKLFSLGLDVNAVDSSSRSALFFCSSAKDIHLLNKNGIDLNQKNRAQRTALYNFIIDAHNGSGQNTEEKILTLINLGAEYNKKNFSLLPKKLHNEVKELVGNIELQKKLEKTLTSKPSKHKKLKI